MILQKPNNQPVNRAILHCAAVPDGWADKRSAAFAALEVDRWHRENGWKGIGYHFVVMPDGSIALGRSVYEAGAHTIGQNSGSVGILMVEKQGVIRIEETPLINFGQLQIAAVKGILSTLAAINPKLLVKGHNDYDRRLCPSFKVKSSDWLPEMPFFK